jgi:hypothetical protein
LVLGSTAHPVWEESELSLRGSFATQNKISAAIEHDGHVAVVLYERSPLSFGDWLSERVDMVLAAMVAVWVAAVSLFAVAVVAALLSAIVRRCWQIVTQ